MGSSVKPYTYFTAFQEYGPWMAAPDVRGMTFGNYDPPNWDNRTQGIMTAREALVKSRNKPAVYTLQTVGITPVMQNMEKMGITTLTNPNQYGLSFTLGTAEMKLLEHAGAYTIFADGGVKHDITPILKVEDSNGEVLLEYEDKKERVFSEEDTYMINWTLCDLGGHGDQAYADQGMYNINGVRAACGKTGTTDGRTDLVTIQYHRNMVAAVWAGNNNNDEGTSQAWSTTVPLPIVHSFMERVSRDYPSKLYSRPANVREATVCKDTGRMASDGVKCPKEKTVYVKDRQPPKDKREVVHVCKSNDMIASNYEQAKEFDIIKDRMYLNFTPENSQQLKTLKRFYEGRKSGGLKILFNEPKEAVCELPLGPDGEPVVEITSPSSGFSIGAGETLRINADVRAGNDVDRVELLFDGDLIESTTDNEAPFELEYQIPSGTPSGEYLVSIRAVDSEGKIGTTSINISVVNEGTSIEWLNPADGDTFSLPANLEVEILGFNPNSVVFVIEGDGSTYSNTIMDTDGSDGWSVSWDDSLASPGNYTIQARAVNGVNVITSATISVTVN
jgi:membrane carboxypeptidase/penicillin-binding protein PbpC